MLGIFLDTETNGLNPQIHKIIEIAYKIVDLSTGSLQEEFHSIVAQPIEVFEKSDPNSLKINGFSWNEICAGKESRVIAQTIIDSFIKWEIRRKKAVFICQNPSVDRIFFSQLIDADTQEQLLWPYHWLDLASMYWAMTMQIAKQNLGPLPWETGFSKDLIANHYKLAPEAMPHRAMNGVSHLLLCYQAVVGFPQVTEH